MKRPYLLLFIATLSIFIACKKENQYSESASKPESSKTSHKAPNANAITSEGNEGMMEFAEPTPNPYTLENMQQALDQLTAEANAGEISFDPYMFNIRATHKYIVFKPTNDEDYETLIDDTTLILFDYPLDRKIIKGGTYYKDPEVQEGQPNYQWTCVPIEKQIDIGVHYEVLTELYLLEEDPNLVEYYEKEEDDYITMLIDKAMQLTGNYDTAYNYDAMTNDGTMEKWWKLPSKWTPKGRITMSDDVLGTVNMRGVKVRAHRWFELRECLTDWNSHFNILHQFRYPINYSIKWERNDFNIRNGKYLQAYYNGPHHRGDWNLNISSGLSSFFASIHRAAHKYYYNNALGVKSPPKNTTTSTRIALGLLDETGRPFYRRHNRYWITPEIFIYTKRVYKNNGQEIEYKPNTREIVSTTIHELAHGSHFDISHWHYRNTDDIVKESWAVGVEWAFDKQIYDVNEDWQSVSLSYMKDPDDGEQKYTPLVIDPIDDINQRDLFWGNTDYPIDNVKGHSIKQIENALKEQLELQTWRNNLNSIYDISPDADVDELFLNYINIQ
jgi:hypothetical protein